MGELEPILKLRVGLIKHNDFVGGGSCETEND